MPSGNTATADLHPAGATDAHLTTRRIQEHQIPEATIRPDGRGAMVVFHLRQRAQMRSVTTREFMAGVAIA
jgi:hypothetical protein